MSGRWEVTSNNVTTGCVSTELFDAVMVCSGHHAEKNMPHFEGDDQFLGQIIHSHDYRDPRGYEDKRVVVVGIGNSAVDVAVELGRNSKQVYLSTRHGAWIVNRVWDNGLPIDLQISRATSLLIKLLPGWLFSSIMERHVNARFNHDLYGLRPDHRYGQHLPTLSDDLPNCIMVGQVIVRPNIRRLTRTGVIFDDGSTVENIDAIICATGYIYSFPFLDSDLFEVKDNHVDLYKFVFPPDAEPHGTLAFIGCCQPTGGFIPVFEMQCRWAARVFKGECGLPSSAEMWAEIRREREEIARHFPLHAESLRLAAAIDSVAYQTDLAERCGCNLNLLKLLVRDPVLAYHVLFGPYCPYQNRLVGPGAWGGARQAVLTTMQRVQRGFNAPLGQGAVGRGSGGVERALFLVAGLCLLLALIYRWTL